MYAGVRIHRRPKRRQLGFEGMEPRVLLSADGFDEVATLAAGEPGDVVTTRLQVSDGDGSPISSIRVGEEFKLSVFAEDTRESATEKGIFAMYLDVTFEGSLATVNQPLEFSADFANGRSGTTSTDGLIDDAGAFTRRMTPNEGEVLIFSAQLIAESTGTLTFRSDPADTPPITEILLFDTRGVIDSEDVLFDTTSVTVLPAAYESVQILMLEETTRDSLTQLSIQFSEDVSEIVNGDSLQLENRNTGIAVDTGNISVDWEPATNTATWSLVGKELSKGLYSIVIAANSFNQSESVRLDGNGDGLFGDDYLGMLAITWDGDLDQDFDVDFADFLAFSSQFGNSGEEVGLADIDGDQTVGFSDFLLLSSNFGKSI